MKIRTDYVTNSSSSSFVIGKMDDESVTIESVYSTIRSLYLGYIQKRKELLEYITNNPKLNIKYIEDEQYGCTYFRCIADSTEKKYEIKKSIERDFGRFIMDSYYGRDEEWLKFETYAEYEKYWLNKMEKTNDWRVRAPFTIIDFLEAKEITWLHFKGKEFYPVDTTNDVFSWYYPYFDETTYNINDCENCSEYGYCEEDECKKTKELIESKTIPLDKACLYLLGRVCVCSECGYIIDYVVNQLHELSEHSCNHMG